MRAARHTDPRPGIPAARQPRFEIVRTATGWRARFRAGNGQVVWTTEVYTRRGAAENAVLCIAHAFWCAAVLHTYDGRTEVRVDQYMTIGVEVREVDER